MNEFSNIIVTRTTRELGAAARASREKAGVSLRKSSRDNPYGVRFLSEFERGKSTAELGKVMQALHAAGLDLAVVPRRTQAVHTERLSKRLNLEFPYDWSNPEMNESTLISLVLEKARFNDILSIAHYFGIERIAAEANNFADTPQSILINKYLGRIKKGIALAAI
ncbi:MAG: hypothetical protein GXP13_02670 [Gammaproteobacteria bacterium]|nr:hypothetical protein [Gammaproteobacteria bacterium]